MSLITSEMLKVAPLPFTFYNPTHIQKAIPLVFYVIFTAAIEYTEMLIETKSLIYYYSHLCLDSAV